MVAEWNVVNGDLGDQWQTVVQLVVVLYVTQQGQYID